MKEVIHPTYFDKATIKCACGNAIKTGSIKEHLEIEICSNCHPFYTGKSKLIDAAGRVEKYKTRLLKRVATQTKAPRARKTKS
ncbi:MAG: 50S ribosomal protein L31 [Candidatus Sungbacteria bacterium]|uniref:50S ribosomal protein L31 n=1 Tax=Candidatus Sungiibacteriota bacterium TaxID=2750080 RepID=A0A9D6LMX3_9BACT|nr:50S ribosomal protein L31 [Candidatus Sungbacteria bacterium]